MRGKFLNGKFKEDDDTLEIKYEVAERIIKLNEQLYLNSGFDIWPLLFKYLDGQIEKL